MSGRNSKLLRKVMRTVETGVEGHDEPFLNLRTLKLKKSAKRWFVSLSAKKKSAMRKRMFARG